MWAVVDDVWVVNVTGFLPHHPGGAAILGANLSAHFSFAHGREAHFRSTAEVFAEATAAFDAQPSKPPRYRWYLGCILLKVPAVSLRAGVCTWRRVWRAKSARWRAASARHSSSDSSAWSGAHSPLLA